MNRAPTRNIVLSCVTILVVACLCLAALGLTRAGIRAWQSAQPAGSAALPTPAPITPRPTLAPAPGEASPTPRPESATLDLPEEIAQQLDVIEREVQQIRGLQPLYSVPRYLLSREQLRQRLVDDLLSDYTEEDARDEAISMAAFGLLEPGFDLRELLLDLYTEQIAGYYDDEVKAMYVIQGDEFQAADKHTYAHEYGHALQDMYFDLKNGPGLSDEFCEDNSDPCSASQAMVEGDATLVGNTWLFEYATEQDRAELVESAQNYSSPIYDNAPFFLQQSFVFPYTGGLEFIQSRFDLGGWNAVNSAFADPPDSSEQILHPDLYPSDNPQEVSLPDLAVTLGQDWRKVDDDIMGEYGLFLILTSGMDSTARLEDNLARTATAGWDGDRYQVWTRAGDGAVVVVLRAVWDSEADASQFNGALQQYGSTVWTDQSHLVEQDGTGTLWLLAPDETLLETLVQSVTP